MTCPVCKTETVAPKAGEIKWSCPRHVGIEAEPIAYADMPHELRVHHKARDVAWFVFKCIDSDHYVLTDGRLHLWGSLDNHERLIDAKHALNEENNIHAAMRRVEQDEEIPF